jgi:hypothetical protein
MVRDCTKQIQHFLGDRTADKQLESVCTYYVSSEASKNLRKIGDILPIYNDTAKKQFKGHTDWSRHERAAEVYWNHPAYKYGNGDLLALLFPMPVVHGLDNGRRGPCGP